ncbi:TetR/AcrR family transcriptional regulator [Nocardia uniformis]|nr:TetR/AcrR family transcriptional regulator [Nocardia uniformis]
MPTSRRKGAHGRSDYHHGDLRHALVAAGHELIRENGVAALTLRAAAAKASVSSAAPYRHFPDKESLLGAVMAAGFRALAAEVTVAVADPLDHLRAIGRRHAEFAAKEPELYRLMLGTAVADRSGHPELAEAERDLYEIFREAVAAAIDAGAIEASSVDDVVLTMRCVMQGLTLMIANGQVTSGQAATVAETVMAVVDSGLRPRS